jgi:hypothetical protein
MMNFEKTFIVESETQEETTAQETAQERSYETSTSKYL